MKKKTRQITIKCVELIKKTEDRTPLGVDSPSSDFKHTPLNSNNEVYSNKNDRLGIDFKVERISFPDIQTMDPRVVKIQPGKTNEKHRHAHESIFVILSGDAEILIGESKISAKVGDIIFVPRWEMHQSKNTSDKTDLVILAITDFGFTSAVLGDYDKRTRLKENGIDSSK